MKKRYVLMIGLICMMLLIGPAAAGVYEVTTNIEPSKLTLSYHCSVITHDAPIHADLYYDNGEPYDGKLGIVTIEIFRPIQRPQHVDYVSIGSGSTTVDVPNQIDLAIKPPKYIPEFCDQLWVTVTRINPDGTEVQTGRIYPPLLFLWGKPITEGSALTDDTCSAVSECKERLCPEFPSMIFPVIGIIGLLGAVFYIQGTRKH